MLAAGARARRGLAAALLWVAALPAPAAEIDSVTHRRSALHDSLAALDSRFDRALREGVERANAEGAGCDEERLYAQLRRAIVSPFIGQLLAERLQEDPALRTRRVRLRDSIYRDLSLLDAVSVHLRDLAAVLRIGDRIVGVDKLGHFFVEGFAYFRIAYLEGKGVDAAIDWGEHSERTYFGLYTTGIYSQADLAVNFEGMRFWLRVLGQERDPLRSGWLFNRPYVACGRRFWSREPVWKLKRRFRLKTWLSGAWDEEVNCSRYANPEIEALIARRIREQGAADDTDYSCPVDTAGCADARERYGEYASRLLHPRCLEADRPRRFRWGIW